MAKVKVKRYFGAMKKGTTVQMGMRQLSLTGSHPTSGSLGDVKPVDATDPKGAKVMIAVSVTIHVCNIPPTTPGKPPAVDVSQLVPANFATNPDVVAGDINTCASMSAKAWSYTWTDVNQGNVTGLSKLGDLVDLVKAHLS